MTSNTLARSVAGATCRLRLEIRGAVQGVGFRPFVYRLASQAGLAGWVLNGAAGVVIEVDGDREPLERFSARVEREHPPVARIISVERSWLEPAGFQGFTIAHSDEAGARSVQVLPDIATCPQCLAELSDPADRRHRYPFTNCTNCGPRFTIVEALPYDRPNTTMAGFALCPRCREEYQSPLDRRFHAQPNACPACGPRLELVPLAPWPPLPLRGEGESEQGAPIGIPPSPAQVEGGPGRVRATGDDALQGAAQAIRAGKIVAVKGLGGFHLVCDA
ncbi:MAG: carbamoyltransferase HypF, partial [Chloroflexales bacterium]|nr:carbamoyltransferase HypF [Chloroflexales bacterium]